MRPDIIQQTGDNSVSFRHSDAVLAEYRRQRIRRDLGRWSRKVLLCLGLENIGKHIVGESKWEKLYDNGCSRKCSSPEQDEGVAVNSMEPSVEHTIAEKEPPCSVKEEGEDDEEVEDQVPAEEGEQRASSTQPISEDTNSPGASPRASPGAQSYKESKIENDVGLAVSASNESSNHSLIAEAAPNSNSREILKEEDDLQNTSRSGSTPSQEADEPASPTGSEAVDQEEGGGGALANNLFQILPYWYFLNRAFSMSAAEGGGPRGAAFDEAGRGDMGISSNGEQEKDEEPEDEDEEMASDEPPSRSVHAMMMRDEGERSPPHTSRSPETTQRINSLILLESLQQRLRTQGEQGATGDMSALNHGLYLSQLLSRMAGKDEGTGGRNGSFPSSINRDQSNDPMRRSPLTDNVLEEQPLDLRRSSMKEPDEEMDGRRRRDEQRLCPADAYPGNSSALPLPYMLDEQTSKVFRSNPRSSKGYTAQELQAALHDIQSGKLGTRRAAVIYGIPRSTLRNKVYKLGKDRGRSLHMGGGPQPGPDYLHLNNNNNNNNLRSKEAAMRKELLGKLSNFRPLSEGYQCTSSNEPDSASFINPGGAPNSAFSAINGDHHDSGKLDVSPSLSHLILKHAQAQKRPPPPLQSRLAAGLPLGMDSDDLRSSLYNESEHASSFLTGKDWKEALARHELLLQHDQRHHPSAIGGHSGRGPPQSHLGGDDASSSMDLAGKKSRPKRGKYRNYDREALVKAVRAVQNGEMSVHRAGSFFGVPHSTLEYKVKERHLLRRPKRKEMTSPLTQSKLSAVAESSSDSGMMAVHNQPSRDDHTSSSFLAREKAKLITKNVRYESGGGGLFPVTADLRESLSRYLSSEQAQKKPSSFNDETDGQDGFDSEDGGRNEGNSSPISHTSRNTLRQKEENGDGGTGPSTLGGFIGNRLSDLFQLSDIFFRTGGSADSAPASREALLDLSKK